MKITKLGYSIEIGEIGGVQHTNWGDWLGYRTPIGYSTQIVDRREKLWYSQNMSETGNRILLRQNEHIYDVHLNIFHVH